MSDITGVVVYSFLLAVVAPWMVYGLQLWVRGGEER